MLLGVLPDGKRTASEEIGDGHKEIVKEHKLVESNENRYVVCYVKMKEELGIKEAQNKCFRSKYQCNICKKKLLCNLLL